MIPTKNDLPETTRAAIVDLLNGELADAIHLSLQAKQAHWNVKGPHFRQLHELFDQVYAASAEWVDLLAERAVQLGGLADGTLAGVAHRTRLAPYESRLVRGRDHVDALSTRLAAFGKTIRASIDRATELGDADTADVLTEVSRGADKHLWFLEAHLQGD
ncbi:MAG: DNA starvation/stationary phase protection protein Dps [Deltaproteobacteria bacterium]|nr:DNA starvation/stationary phase protection protein Dps [Deltaproteobacteria bacterium]